jgi:queuine/archaeosine tRNA-ribosyltransferase
MTLKHFIEFAKETNAKIVNDRGTLTIECKDECTIRRAIISNIIIEEDIVVEGKAGRESIPSTTRKTHRRTHKHVGSGRRNSHIFIKKRQTIELWKSDFF